MRPGPIGSTAISRPMPLVVRKAPSALPRSTTLVSPVTTWTAQSVAAAATEARMRRSSASSSPSSRIRPRLRAQGRAPAMARSLQVPTTARRPMSPPGNSRGFTT